MQELLKTTQKQLAREKDTVKKLQEQLAKTVSVYLLPVRAGAVLVLLASWLAGPSPCPPLSTGQQRRQGGHLRLSLVCHKDLTVRLYQNALHIPLMSPSAQHHSVIQAHLPGAPREAIGDGALSTTETDLEAL